MCKSRGDGVNEHTQHIAQRVILAIECKGCRVCHLAVRHRGHALPLHGQNHACQPIWYIHGARKLRGNKATGAVVHWYSVLYVRSSLSPPHHNSRVLRRRSVKIAPSGLGLRVLNDGHRRTRRARGRKKNLRAAAGGAGAFFFIIGRGGGGGGAAR
jgi:hypothetical protein